MPDKKTLRRAKRDKQEGKAPTTQAGEFIREEFHHIRQGRHGARSAQQAIAIGLSKARRAGVELKPPAPGEQSESTRHKAQQDSERGHRRTSQRASPKRSAATERALQREPHASASRRAIGAHAHRAATRRSKAQRSAAARRAARTRGRARSR
jgi:hypothetical protein